MIHLSGVVAITRVPCSIAIQREYLGKAQGNTTFFYHSKAFYRRSVLTKESICSIKTISKKLSKIIPIPCLASVVWGTLRIRSYGGIFFHITILTLRNYDSLTILLVKTPYLYVFLTF